MKVERQLGDGRRNVSAFLLFYNIRILFREVEVEVEVEQLDENELKHVYLPRMYFNVYYLYLYFVIFK